MGEAAQTARGASRLQLALDTGTPPVAAGEQGFSRTGLGCASCHGDQAEGARGPGLAGGQELPDFRRVHGQGLFPRSVVSDKDFAAVNAWLKTLPSGRGG
jgi:mono/diheme cytochrome c family protein